MWTFHPWSFLWAFRPSPSIVKWIWTISAFSTNERDLKIKIRSWAVNLVYEATLIRGGVFYVESMDITLFNCLSTISFYKHSVSNASPKFIRLNLLRQAYIWYNSNTLHDKFSSPPNHVTQLNKIVDERYIGMRHFLPSSLSPTNMVHCIWTSPHDSGPCLY